MIEEGLQKKNSDVITVHMFNENNNHINEWSYYNLSD